MVKISVIIPVYNTEEYLSECLDSIVNQTLKDIEIICINDGSTDNSLNILENYTKKDNRITIVSQKNNGQGCARNYGLKIATGEYIYFIDSDDKIKLNTLEECYNMALNSNLDFVMFQLINYTQETNEYYQDGHYDMPQVVNLVRDKIFSYEDLDKLIFNVAVSPVNKLYNRQFLNSINAKFPEDIIFEDNIFFWNVFLNAKRIFFIPEHFYIRRRHDSSTTGKPGIRFIDTLEVNNRTINIFKENGIFEKYISELFDKKLNLAYYRFDAVKSDVKPVFFDEMKNDFQKMTEEYGLKTILSSINKNNKIMFKYVINSDTSQEFILLMKRHQLESKNKKWKSKNKKLKKQTKKLEKENKLILSSNSWKVTKPMRFISNLFK